MNPIDPLGLEESTASRPWRRVARFPMAIWAVTTLALGALALGGWRLAVQGDGLLPRVLLGIASMAFLGVTWACLRLRRILSAIVVQARELRVLEEAGRAAASTLDLEDMGRRIGQVLLQAFPDIVGIVLTVTESDAGPHRDLARARDRSLKPLLVSIVHRFLRQEHGLVDAPWLKDQPDQDPFLPPLRVLSTRLFSPAQGSVLGFASLVVQDDRRAVDEIRPILDPLARQVSLAIENWRLYTLATEDGLTGLYVRRYVEARLREEFDRSARTGKPFCLLMIDVDNLKTINDRWGHAAGDHLLREVGEALRRSLRAMDVPGRVGGDEFLVLLPDTDLAEGLETARRIQAEVSNRSFETQRVSIHPKVSIGVASSESSPQPRSVTEIQSRADEALYRAKRGDRKIVIWKAGANETL